MSAPKAVLDLIEHFQRNLDDFKSGRYSEEHVRLQFLNPLFKALGWDVYNESQTAEAYKDVIHEDALRIGSGVKAPDYCFRIGGTRKFFLEAKKPSVFIKEEISAAYQLRRYAWTAKLPLSILSDFEEFAIYDCRIKPKPNDKASIGRIFYCGFRELPEKWDHIAGIFSKDAVLKGSFDKYAAENKAKRGTAEVDADFLEEIERWRKELAQNLALRNEKLSQRELNFAVQRIIDRVIFLRIAEDRGLETYGRLQALTNGPRIYPRLCELFDAADARYNSGLFHFKRERDRHEAPDELTMRLEVDDKLLKDILKNLYYPESPYAFSVLSADILGQVYEQFLGKVITLTEGHRARVDAKPEVKKAGGVYYTPTYIVDYIVRETVGKLVDGKTPKQVEKIRVLDPACGSGSFLIGAYQFLLDWHLTYYMANDAAKWAKEITVTRGSKGKHPVLVPTRANTWQLSIAERKRILLNNIYGVDIDSQAVEVTKLSLLLKVLEGEAGLAQMSLGLADRVLPDLGDNIKCGNSLIGPDFYAQPDLPELSDEEKFRINVFDWKAEFKEVFQAGGFDAVIGNPPYIRIQTMQDTQPLEVRYFDQSYGTARHGNYDIYVVFVERGLSLLNTSGKLGFILPHKFFNTEYGRPVRQLLTSGRHVEQLVHFGHNQVFASATTYTCLLFLKKSGVRKFSFVQVETLSEWVKTGRAERAELLCDAIDECPWNIHAGPAAAVMRRLSKMEKTLGDVARLFVGLQTDADDVYILQKISRKGSQILCKSAATEQEHWFEAGHLKPFLKGSLDVRRYGVLGAEKFLIFPYHNTGEKSLLISPADYAKLYPLTWAYLRESKPRLEKRAKGTLGSAWYGYVYKKNHLRFDQAKILAPAIARGACFAWDSAGEFYFVGSGGGGGGGYGIALAKDVELSPLFVLGLLNSKLTSFFLKQTSSVFRGGYIALNRQYIERIPLAPLSLDLETDRIKHSRTVFLVERMLHLQRQRAAARTPQEQTILDRQIQSTDAEIDRLVYELYGLTEEEIRIVEGTEPSAAESIATDSLAIPEPQPAGSPADLPNGQSTGQSEGDAAHYYSFKEPPPKYN